MIIKYVLLFTSMTYCTYAALITTTPFNTSTPLLGGTYAVGYAPRYIKRPRYPAPPPVKVIEYESVKDPTTLELVRRPKLPVLPEVGSLDWCTIAVCDLALVLCHCEDHARAEAMYHTQWVTTLRSKGTAYARLDLVDTNSTLKALKAGGVIPRSNPYDIHLSDKRLQRIISSLSKVHNHIKFIVMVEQATKL